MTLSSSLKGVGKGLVLIELILLFSTLQFNIALTYWTARTGLAMISTDISKKLCHHSKNATSSSSIIISIENIWIKHLHLFYESLIQFKLFFCLNRSWKHNLILFLCTSIIIKQLSELLFELLNSVLLIKICLLKFSKFIVVLFSLNTKLLRTDYTCFSRLKLSYFIV